MLLTERGQLERGDESPCACGGTLRRLEDGRLECNSCGRTIVMREHIVRAFECLRCEHQWVPRVAGVPKKCPRCGSYDWNKPYAYKKAGRPEPGRERKPPVTPRRKPKGWVAPDTSIMPPKETP